MHLTDSTGTPGRPVLLPIEMKNRRITLYPIHKEVYQLLAKASRLQQAAPDYPIVPILFCRRAHSRLFWMAKDLGFLVHDAKRQFVRHPEGVDPRLFNAVRTGLGLNDLTPIDHGHTASIKTFLEETLPLKVPQQVPRWAVAASVVGPYADQLRKDSSALTSFARLDLVRDLRRDIETAFDTAGISGRYGWSLPDDSDPDEEYEDPD